MRISDRSIRASRAHISPNRKPRKSFPATVKTAGDRIRFKRVEKGISLSGLAQKLGVAKPVISKWERDILAPDENQRRMLDSILCSDAALKQTKPNT